MTAQLLACCVMVGVNGCGVRACCCDKGGHREVWPIHGSWQVWDAEGSISQPKYHCLESAWGSRCVWPLSLSRGITRTAALVSLAYRPGSMCSAVVDQILISVVAVVNVSALVSFSRSVKIFKWRWSAPGSSSPDCGIPGFPRWA